MPTSPHPHAATSGAVLAAVLVLSAGASTAQEPAAEPSTPMRHHTGHHRFDDAERWSKQFDSSERDAWQKPDEVISLMEIAPGTTLADIGAGTGYFLGHLAAATGPEGRVLGLDIEPSMVEFMTERAEGEGWQNVEARLVEPDDPKLQEGEVDRILIVNTWHHIADRAAYAAILRSALAPGGRIYIVDLTLESSYGPPVQDRLTPEQVIEDLEAGGLQATLIEETLPEQYIVLAR